MWDEAREKADRIMMHTLFPIFRRNWRPQEEPICILGTTVHKQTLMILVRIKGPEDEDVEAIKKNPIVGLKFENTRITLSPTLQKYHAQMLIQYYESKLVFVEDAKTLEERAEDAARARLLHLVDTQGLNVDRNEICQDMMKDLPEQLGGDGKEDVEGEPEEEEVPKAGPSSAMASSSGLLNAETKKELLKVYTSPQISAPPKRKVVDADKDEEDEDTEECWSDEEEELDKFGLPVDYGESDFSEYSSSDEA